MKTILFSALALFVSLSANAQHLHEPCDTESMMFDIVEHPAYYTPGKEQFQADLNTALKGKIDKSATGIMFFLIAINCKGEVVETKVLRGFNDAVNDVVLKEVSQFTDWTPGVQRETRIDYKHKVMIQFENGNVIKAGG